MIFWLVLFSCWRLRLEIDLLMGFDFPCRMEKISTRIEGTEVGFLMKCKKTLIPVARKLLAFRAILQTQSADVNKNHSDNAL